MAFLFLLNFSFAFASVSTSENYSLQIGGNMPAGMGADSENYGDFYWVNEQTAGAAASGNYGEGLGFAHADVNNEAPSISITSPADGSTITTTTVTLNYSAASEVGIKNYWVKVDTGNWIYTSETSYSFTSQSNGVHMYYAKATDLFDQNSNIAYVQVTVDYFPPLVETCGNGSCAGGENCSNCPSDCGPCGGGGDGGGGGGSGGGGGIRLKGLGEACTNNSECGSQKCIEKTCSECTSSATCAANEFCSANHLCLEIPPACGQIENHVFIPYECCSNSDCAADKTCNADSHSCVASKGPRLVITHVPSVVVSGQSVTFTVTDENGNIATDVTLTIGSEKNLLSIAKMETVLAAGTVQIKAEKKGYASDGLTLSVIEQLSLVAPQIAYKGTATEILVLDEKGRPAVNKEVVLTMPDGTQYTLKTNENGVVLLQTELIGNIKIEAKNTGYVVATKMISIENAPIAETQNFPFYILAVIAGGTVLYILLTMHKKRRRKKPRLYYRK
ncbi:MAG: Ig-like domain-containing protein [Candidatus Micrarchaeota archaeon]